MRNIKHIFLFAIAGLFMASCGEREFDIYDGPNQAHFVGSSGTYFVQQANDPGFPIELGALSPASGSLTLNVEVVDSLSTAVEGTHYTLSSNTISFSDGQALTELLVTGNFDNLTSDQTLVLALTGDNVAGFDNTYSLNLTQFCPYVQADFAGTYTFTSSAFGATYEVEAVAGASENEVVFQNLYEDGFNVTVSLDASDPTNFTADVQKQDAWISAQYGQARVEGSGSFNACERTITLNLEHTVDAGSFGVFAESLVKN